MDDQVRSQIVTAISDSWETVNKSGKYNQQHIVDLDDVINIVIKAFEFQFKDDHIRNKEIKNYIDMILG